MGLQFPNHFHRRWRWLNLIQHQSSNCPRLFVNVQNSILIPSSAATVHKLEYVSGHGTFSKVRLLSLILCHPVPGRGSQPDATALVQVIYYTETDQKSITVVGRLADSLNEAQQTTTAPALLPQSAAITYRCEKFYDSTIMTRTPVSTAEISEIYRATPRTAGQRDGAGGGRRRGVSTKEANWRR